MAHIYNIPAGLEKSASTDAARYIMNGVHFNAEHDEWAATDGRLLTVYPEAANGRPSVIIPLDCIKRHRKTGMSIEFDGARTLTCGGQEFRALDGLYPNYRQVIPKAEEYAEHFVCINALALEQIFAAMPRSERKMCRVRIRLAGKNPELSPVVIESMEKDGPRAVLMPLRDTAS